MENRPDIAENHGKMGENKDVANTVQVCDFNSKMLQKRMQMRDFFPRCSNKKTQMRDSGFPNAANGMRF